MKKIILLNFVFIFFSQFSLAQSDYVQLTDSSTQSTVKLKALFKFIKHPEGAEMMGALTQINLPDSSGIRSVDGESVFYQTKWQKNPSKLYVLLGALKNDFSVELNSGKRINFNAELKMNKSRIMNSKCGKLGITIVESKMDASPIFIGLKCMKTKDKNLIHISVPKELELASSNVFEMSGKGERWKVYDIRQIGSGPNSTAQFNYSWSDKNFSFKLKSKLSGEKAPQIVIKKEESFIKARLGLGGAQVSYTTPTQSKGAVSPLLYANILTKEYFWKFIGKIDLLFAMPLSGQQFYSFNLGTGPQFNFGSTSASLFFEYLTLGQDESETGTSFSHSQMGVGFDLNFGQDSKFGLYANYNGLGGSSNHIGAKLYYLLKRASGNEWGAFLAYGKQTATSTITNNDSSFSQMMLAATYAF